MTQDEIRYLTIQQAKEDYGVPYWRIVKWVNLGLLRKYGSIDNMRKLRFREDELLAAIAKSAQITPKTPKT